MKIDRNMTIAIAMFIVALVSIAVYAVDTVNLQSGIIEQLSK